MNSKTRRPWPMSFANASRHPTIRAWPIPPSPTSKTAWRPSPGRAASWPSIRAWRPSAPPSFRSLRPAPMWSPRATFSAIPMRCSPKPWRALGSKCDFATSRVPNNSKRSSMSTRPVSSSKSSPIRSWKWPMCVHWPRWRTVAGCRWWPTRRSLWFRQIRRLPRGKRSRTPAAFHRRGLSPARSHRMRGRRHALLLDRVGVRRRQ